MPSVNQRYFWMQKIMKEVAEARNVVQVLRDVINTYVTDEPGLSEREKAIRLAEIDLRIGGSDFGTVAYRIQKLVDWVDGSLTPAQRGDVLAAYSAWTNSIGGDGPAASAEIQNIYARLKALSATLANLRQPSRSLSSSYDQFAQDMKSIVSEINQIPNIELGSGPVG